MPLLPPPILISRTVLVAVFASSSAKLGDDAQAVLAVLLRPVARFAGLARWAQVGDRRRDGPRVGVERHREHLPHAGELALHEPPGARPDMALDALHARVRRVQVGRVLGLHHVVAGLAAERHRVHVVHRAVAELAGDGDVHDRGDADEVDQPAHFGIAPAQAYSSIGGMPVRPSRRRLRQIPSGIRKRPRKNGPGIVRKARIPM